MNFKKDYGTYVKNSGLYEKGSFVVQEPFVPINLVLYPNGNSSITANIDGMLATFDFNDEVLKVFLYIFKKFELIEESDIRNKVFLQENEPIVIRFSESLFLLEITGMAFACELLEQETSSTTSEEFIPLFITKALIVKEEIGNLVPKASHVQ